MGASHQRSPLAPLSARLAPPTAAFALAPSGSNGSLPLAPPQPPRPAAGEAKLPLRTPSGGCRRPFLSPPRLPAQVRACRGGGRRPPLSQAHVPSRGEGDACQRALGSAVPALAGPPLPPRTFPFPSAGRGSPPAAPLRQHHMVLRGGGAAPRPSSLFQSQRSTPAGPGGRRCPLTAAGKRLRARRVPPADAPLCPTASPAAAAAGGCGSSSSPLLSADCAWLQVRGSAPTPRRRDPRAEPSVLPPSRRGARRDPRRAAGMAGRGSEGWLGAAAPGGAPRWEGCTAAVIARGKIVIKSFVIN